MTPSEELRNSYLRIIRSRWELSPTEIFSDPVWPPLNTMSGAFLSLVCELAKKMKFQPALKKMKQIVKAEKEECIAFVTVSDLLMHNDAPPLHECKSYRGIHHYETHRRLGVLSKRGRRKDQKMMKTAPIVPIRPQAITAKYLCQKLFKTWGQWAPPRVGNQDDDEDDEAGSENPVSEDENDDEIEPESESDDETPDANDDVQAQCKTDEEPVDTTIYDATPAPPSRREHEREKSTPSSSKQKADTPEVTEKRNLKRAFPKRKAFKAPKTEPSVKEEENIDLNTIPLNEQVPGLTLRERDVKPEKQEFVDVHEEIKVLKAARLTKVDAAPMANFEYQRMEIKELQFMKKMCGYGKNLKEKTYLVQRICTNWNLPADEVFAVDHAMWPISPAMSFLLRLLVLSHVTKHRTAVAELKKVLEKDKREAGDILEMRWLDETTVDRAIDLVCPRAKDALKELKLQRAAEAKRVKREPSPEQIHEPEPTPAFSPPPPAAEMPPLPPRSTGQRRSRSLTVDICTHEKCAMVPSNAFWEANPIIGSDGKAHLTTSAMEADLVPKCEMDPQLPKTKRRRRLSSVKNEDKENVPEGDAENEKADETPQVVEPPKKKAKHAWAKE